MTDDDFIIENETEGSSRRPFLLIVAVLSTIFILATACSLIYIFANGSLTNTAQSDEVLTRVALNETRTMENATVTAAIEATNTFIAGIEATNTALANATETPEPTEAATNTPTTIADTATPEETAVVVIKDTVTPNTSGTSAVESAPSEESEESSEDGTAESSENVSEASETATPIPATTNNDSENEALPQTGINTWGSLIAGFALIAILVAARRLRQA